MLRQAWSVLLWCAAMNEPSTAETPAYPETADIETSSDAYAARFAGAAGQWMLEVQERLTLAMLADRPEVSVLDVGGGHGQLAVPLCREGYRVTVLGSAASCRKRVAGVVEAGRCTFLTGNVIALPFPDRSFDVVIAFRLLTHCEAWPVLIKELCRVARQSVIVDYPTSQGLNAIAPALFDAKKKLEGDTRHWRQFQHREVLGEFAKQGYTEFRRAPQFFLPMVLHRVLRSRFISAGLEGICRALGFTKRWGSPVILEVKRET
jgi:ubiquinone/menaquinone biosynthesis C-methylase UbiE